MALTLNASQERKELRTETMHIFGRMLTRTFEINKPAIDSVKPVRGDLLVGWKGDAVGLARPRVTSYQYSDNKGGSKSYLAISAIEPIPYASDHAVTMELSGSRTPLDGNAMFTELKTIHVSVASESAGVPQEGDLYSGDSAIIGKYCIQTQVDKDTVPGLYFTTAIWRQYRIMTGGEANVTPYWIEILGRSIGLTSATRAIGSQSVICADADSATVVDNLWLHPHPRAAAALARRPIAEESAHGMLGVCLVRIGYDSTNRYYVRKHGYARILTTSTVQAEVATFDENDLQISGPLIGATSKLGNVRYPVVGTEVVYNYRMDIVVASAVDAAGFNHSTYRVLQGHVNSATVSSLNAAAGTLRLDRVKTEYQYGDDLVYINYHLVYNPAGWNNYAKSQTGSWQVIKTEADDGAIRYLKMFIPDEQVTAIGTTEATTPDTLKGYPIGDFSQLDAYTYWDA